MPNPHSEQCRAMSAQLSCRALGHHAVSMACPPPFVAEKFELGTEKLVVEVDRIAPGEDGDIRLFYMLFASRLWSEAPLRCLVVVVKAGTHALWGTSGKFVVDRRALAPPPDHATANLAQKEMLVRASGGYHIFSLWGVPLDGTKLEGAPRQCQLAMESPRGQSHRPS